MERASFSCLKTIYPKMEQIAMIWRETMRETFVDEMIWLKAFLGLLRPLFTFNNNRFDDRDHVALRDTDSHFCISIICVLVLQKNRTFCGSYPV
ncbi:hypothetical protein NC653_021128 [Populus alba x Populus x berolinensis]|uniref:Uncharacterized protein n=1 Tax=Populus alba x Populus x berolinensis TaxID=444605 RepID=A0AAD6QDG0_9ROSI|nr:hypothetical protein NC653_021128 [Populus alba x Populus x berolinensis]